MTEEEQASQAVQQVAASIVAARSQKEATKEEVKANTNLGNRLTVVKEVASTSGRIKVRENHTKPTLQSDQVRRSVMKKRTPDWLKALLAETLAATDSPSFMPPLYSMHKQKKLEAPIGMNKKSTCPVSQNVSATTLPACPLSALETPGRTGEASPRSAGICNGTVEASAEGLMTEDKGTSVVESEESPCSAGIDSGTVAAHAEGLMDDKGTSVEEIEGSPCSAGIDNGTVGAQVEGLMTEDKGASVGESEESVCSAGIDNCTVEAQAEGIRAEDKGTSVVESEESPCSARIGKRGTVEAQDEELVTKDQGNLLVESDTSEARTLEAPKVNLPIKDVHSILKHKKLRHMTTRMLLSLLERVRKMEKQITNELERREQPIIPPQQRMESKIPSSIVINNEDQPCIRITSEPSPADEILEEVDMSNATTLESNMMPALAAHECTPQSASTRPYENSTPRNRGKKLQKKMDPLLREYLDASKKIRLKKICNSSRRLLYSKEQEHPISDGSDDERSTEHRIDTSSSSRTSPERSIIEVPRSPIPQPVQFFNIMGSFSSRTGGAAALETKQHELVDAVSKKPFPVAAQNQKKRKAKQKRKKKQADVPIEPNDQSTPVRRSPRGQMPVQNAWTEMYLTMIQQIESKNMKASQRRLERTMNSSLSSSQNSLQSKENSVQTNTNKRVRLSPTCAACGNSTPNKRDQTTIEELPLEDVGKETLETTAVGKNKNPGMEHPQKKRAKKRKIG